MKCSLCSFARFILSYLGALIIPWRFCNTESLSVLDSNIISWWAWSCWFILWPINYKELHAFKSERLSRFVCLVQQI
jgi:hypothetical protein